MDKKSPASFRLYVQQNGFTLIELLISIVIIFILAGIAIPIYTKFVDRARETAVIACLEDIKKAEEVYRLNDPQDHYTKHFSDLIATGLVTSSESKNGKHYEKYNYRFELKAETKDGKNSWRVKARPVDKNKKLRWFYTDQTGVIRYEVGKEAKDSSPPIAT